MQNVDVIVIGGGTGNSVAAAAAEAGLETVLVEKGPLGGTCLNRGCNPSKMLIHRATIMDTIDTAEQFGIDATVHNVDFQGILSDVESTLSGIAEQMEQRYREQDYLTLVKDHARFVDERTIEVAGDTYRADRILLAVGSRPVVPPIDGLADLPFLTSDEALYLDEQPDSLVIVGGGYIGAELGYFFELLGTDVSIVHSNTVLLDREDRDLAEEFTDIASGRHTLVTDHRATAVQERPDGITVQAESEAGDRETVTGEQLLIAVGRRPNTDDLGLEHTAIETDEHGFLRTNEYLETTAEKVWAQGDVAGHFQFKHAGDFETRHAIDFIVHDERQAVDYSAMPHAVFAEPQIGAVGRTEAALVAAGEPFVVGRARYEDTAMGRAKGLEGLAKVLASPAGDILGFHVLGHEASTVVHEAVVAMRSGQGTVWDISDAVHAHPTLSKVVEAAFRDVAGKLSVEHP
ncbi:dihydrolipoyl dehydrogenase family protein [Halodesulfurarchaeum sp.]|uniref:dihydrolipoyl dehydrogenase family protein n=1 Tax=Halodesulfurarchaeum sp. TaxID=1980530 RepID=UPI002FC384DB